MITLAPRDVVDARICRDLQPALICGIIGQSRDVLVSKLDRRPAAVLKVPRDRYRVYRACAVVLVGDER